MNTWQRCTKEECKGSQASNLSSSNDQKPLALVLLKNNFTRFTHTQSERVFWCSASRVNPVQQALSGSGQAKLPKEEHYFLYSKVSLNTFLASRSNPWILLAREVVPILHNTLFFPLVFPKSFWTQYSVEGLPPKNSQIPYYQKAYSLPWIYHFPILCHVLLCWYGKRVTLVIPQDPSSH